MRQRKVEKKIDRILLEAKLISKEQLNDALEKQKKNGQPSGFKEPFGLSVYSTLTVEF